MHSEVTKAQQAGRNFEERDRAWFGLQDFAPTSGLI